MHHQHKNSEFHLTGSEIRSLVEAATTERDRLLVLLLAYTGLRRAEVRSIAVTDIDLERSRLLVRRGKGGKQRLVFLPKELEGHLRRYVSGLESDFLFPGRDHGPMTLRNVNHIIERLSRRSGVEHPNPRHAHVTPHLLRHSFARNWKRQGGSMESLQKLLGHASLRTTMDVYGTEAIDETERNYHELEHLLVSPRLHGNAKV